jgi:hypothetical protein
MSDLTAAIGVTLRIMIGVAGATLVKPVAVGIMFALSLRAKKFQHVVFAAVCTGGVLTVLGATKARTHLDLLQLLIGGLMAFVAMSAGSMVLGTIVFCGKRLVGQDDKERGSPG